MENMLKLKEEFDYKSLARRLDIQLDKIIAEHERQQKVFEDEMERISIQGQNRISDVERNYADALEVNFCTDICLQSKKKEFIVLSCQPALSILVLFFFSQRM